MGQGAEVPSTLIVLNLFNHKEAPSSWNEHGQGKRHDLEVFSAVCSYPASAIFYPWELGHVILPPSLSLSFHFCKK